MLSETLLRTLAGVSMGVPLALDGTVYRNAPFRSVRRRPDNYCVFDAELTGVARLAGCLALVAACWVQKQLFLI